MLLKGNFDNLKWLAGEAHFAFLQQEEKRLSGNDVLALQLIWSQVGFTLKREPMKIEEGGCTLAATRAMERNTPSGQSAQPS